MICNIFIILKEHFLNFEKLFWGWGEFANWVWITFPSPLATLRKSYAMLWTISFLQWKVTSMILRADMSLPWSSQKQWSKEGNKTITLTSKQSPHYNTTGTKVPQLFKESKGLTISSSDEGEEAKRQVFGIFLFDIYPPILSSKGHGSLAMDEATLTHTKHGDACEGH